MTATLPRGSDYQLALQNPRTRFKDPRLQAAQVRSDSNGIPLVWSGGFVVTFQVTLATGQQRAVRCYTQPVPDMADRYARIRPVVQAAPDIFADSDFQAEGIQVGGAWYPVQEMAWIAGQPLNNWISAHCHADALRPLVAEFDTLVAALERLGVAHGDLQHGNILVDGQGHLRLIDYDGMFVPGLANLGTNNQGHRNYQHPARRHEFDATLDRFATIVIGLALRALVAEPSLWATFGQSGECLLFTQDDFLHPATSALLHRLARVPTCAPYLANFRAICGGGLADVPRLADFLATTTPLAIRPASQPVGSWASAYPVLAGGAWNSLLLPFAGQYVELVGQVQSAEPLTTKDGKADPYVRLRFTRQGAYDAAHPATCAVLIFKEGLAAFAAARRDPLALTGQWVAVHQFLEVYTDPRATTGGRPQLRIAEPNDLVELPNAAAARQRLLAGSGGGAVVSPARGSRGHSVSVPAQPPSSAAPVSPLLAATGSAVPVGPSPAERRRREEAERARLNAALWGQVAPAAPPSHPAAAPPAPPPSPVPTRRPTPPTPLATGSAVPGGGLVPPVAPPPLPSTSPPPIPAAPVAAAASPQRSRWRSWWEDVVARLRAARQELTGGG